MAPTARTAPTAIAAITTAPGRGAVGVVRVSGPDSVVQTIATKIVAIKRLNKWTNERNQADFALAARFAQLADFVDADGVAIDRGLALYFPAPHSYTGESVLELQAHGGPVVLQLLLQRCLAVGEPWGLRAARPGEFTERAFLNDKLDLAQAEAVADLIDASTAQAAKSASRSLAGAFSEQVHTLLADLVNLRMLVEATLDFPEEEIEHLSRGKAQAQLASLLARTHVLGQQAQQGSLLREGIRLVIAGQPNVGKSSLLNALAGAEIAIVTPIAGTTRDRIEHAISLGGVPVHVVDTAGLRDTHDTVEAIGIERAWGAVRSADVVLHLHDVTQRHDKQHTLNDAEIAKQFPSDVPVVDAWNKADCAHSDGGAGLDQGAEALLLVSAATGRGLNELRDAVLAAVGHQASAAEGLFMARARHVHALAASLAHLQSAQLHLNDGETLDIAAEELRLSQKRLGEITGEFGADALLGEIFSRFCIGK